MERKSQVKEKKGKRDNYGGMERRRNKKRKRRRKIEWKEEDGVLRLSLMILPRHKITPDRTGKSSWI